MAKAIQSWVKPEVDPPIHNALPRGCVNWEGHRLAWPKFQPQRGVFGRWMRGCVVMGTGLPMAKAIQSWVKPTEDPGGSEEAHRRWPEGRSEQGASKAKVDPPINNALTRGC